MRELRSIPDFPEANRAIKDLADPAHLATATEASEVLSPLRYPGGKRRLAPFIAATLKSNGMHPDLTVEPFAGGASVSLYLLQHGLTEMIGLADADPLVAAFWQTAFFDTQWLVEEIESIPLTLSKWEEFKHGNPQSTRERAMSCLFLNRTSFSGILARSAGPLGGKKQESRYKLGCRFPREVLKGRLQALAQFRNRVAFVYEGDWAETLDAVNQVAKDGWETFTYIDPPFFNKAEKLYRHYFEETEHKSLRDVVIGLSGAWLISYDSVPGVAELYINQRKCDLGAIYTASTAGGFRKVREAVVSSMHLPGDVTSAQPGSKAKVELGAAAGNADGSNSSSPSLREE